MYNKGSTDKKERASFISAIAIIISIIVIITTVVIIGIIVIVAKFAIFTI